MKKLVEGIRILVDGMQCVPISFDDRTLHIDLAAGGTGTSTNWATDKTRDELIAEIEAAIKTLQDMGHPAELITMGDYVDRPAMSVGYDIETGAMLHMAPVKAWLKHDTATDDCADAWIAFSEALRGRRAHEMVVLGMAGTLRNRSMMNAVKFIEMDYTMLETPELKLSHEPLWKQQQHASWKTKR